MRKILLLNHKLSIKLYVQHTNPNSIIENDKLINISLIREVDLIFISLSCFRIIPQRS